MKTRQDNHKARQDKTNTRQGKTRQDKAKQDTATQDKTRQYNTIQGNSIKKKNNRKATSSQSNTRQPQSKARKDNTQPHDDKNLQKKISNCNAIFLINLGKESPPNGWARHCFVHYKTRQPRKDTGKIKSQEK
jgi:hypothetical protein